MVNFTGFMAVVHPVPWIADIPNWQVIIGGLITGGVALVFCAFLTYMIMKADAGTANMQQISRYIQEGAAGFLRAEYTALAVYAAAVAIALGVSSVSYVDGWRVMLCFLAGASTSALAGFVGMLIATRSNVRTAAAAMDAKEGQDPAHHGINAALRVAFNSGTVMGLSVCGLGLLVLCLMFLAFPNFIILAGFGFGGSSIALFARVGGGIFTKAADVGSDLVGKVEAGIPEDDPRNPGTIADNVGDNVGDVAGMGADLFGSFMGSIIAAGALGTSDTSPAGFASPLVALPFWVAAVGILASIIGIMCVRLPAERKDVAPRDQQGALLWAIRIGIFIAAIIVAGVTVACVVVLGITMRVWGCIVIGLVGGIAIGLFTEFATSFHYAPTKGIARAGLTGPATVIIEGLSVGMWSAVPPLLIITVIIICCLYLAGPYGMAIAAVGMLSTLGVTLATDAYGPVADNAGGIAEMAHCAPEVRDRTDALDALGNTTAATGKGFAIGSAVLTAFSLMVAYARNTGIDAVDLINDIMVIPGLLLGAMLPFLFSSLTMKAVGRAAMAMVDEIRRQFREIDGLLEGREGVKGEYTKCVSIATAAALRQMILPGMLPIVATISCGLLLGSKALAAMIAGMIITSFMLAVTMANAGGAWDNAKKFVEAGTIPGHKKGTDLHKAVVVGDTVGDPFKDTSGPALNILIKMSSVLSLMLSPLYSEPWPFQRPNYWIGIIILGAALIATLLFIVQGRYAKKSAAIDSRKDLEMKALQSFEGTAVVPAAAQEPSVEVGDVRLVEAAPPASPAVVADTPASDS
eukprot:TRINITY_DN668_c0_g1_i2.p1 TRINITY_DN668_c0_g1~~TRINITY_DN668_c0_g1_i2.p1  ORF type:complete len:805 (-),score=241.39 TRINITY_DN668_c0_g1_i2:137-2551(-)